MAIKITSWKPDTCGCTIQYSWDDSVPNDDIDHTVHSVPIRCGAHASLPDDDSVFQAVVSENATKNNARALILNSFDQYVNSSVDANGDTVREFKPGYEPVVSFSNPARNVLLSIAPMSAPDKVSAQSLCDAQFGAGKVVIS